jgi:sugar/nucleoside kinase (ribokinase family)
LVEDGLTFRWGGKYSDDYSTRDTLFTELGVFEKFSPSILESDRNSPLVFLGNIHPDLQSSVAKLTLNADYIVTDTMNLWIDLFPEKVAEVLKLSTILLINHEEAEQFTGQSEIANAASELLSYGLEIVVIKRGADGAYLAHGDVRRSVPVFPINILNDPTGAGDSFAGGFMGYLSQSSQPDFLEAVIVGSAMASFCVEGFGVESLLSATPELLEHRVSTIKKTLVETV